MKTGEFELIKKISDIFPMLDTTDDAAFIPIDRGYLIATCDEHSEDIHYRRGWLSYSDIGYRAVASASSDIAACGGNCSHILTAIAIDDETDEDSVLEVYRGIKEFCEEFSIDLIGGNVTKSAKGLSIVTTALGFAEYPVKRSGALVGDLICHTGDIGRCGLSLKHLNNGNMQIPEHIFAKFSRPQPLFKTAIALNRYLHAAIDISDGFISDLSHILQSSGKGAVIDTEAVKTMTGDSKEDKIDAMQSGEEYELIIVLPKANLSICRELADVEITVIGEVCESGLEIRYEGEILNNQIFKGFRHF